MYTFQAMPLKARPLFLPFSLLLACWSMMVGAGAAFLSTRGEMTEQGGMLHSKKSTSASLKPLSFWVSVTRSQGTELAPFTGEVTARLPGVNPKSTTAHQHDLGKSLNMPVISGSSPGA